MEPIWDCKEDSLAERNAGDFKKPSLEAERNFLEALKSDFSGAMADADGRRYLEKT